MTEKSPLATAKHPSVWCTITYFAQGFPYSVVHYLASLFFTYNNVRLEYLGLISLYHLPWNLKFLWSTLIDQFGTKKKWIYKIELLLLISFILLALLAPLGGGIKIAAIIFLIIAFLSATHDIAIDGYYLEKLDKEGQSKFVGMRVMAYRIAMLVISSGIVYLAHISWALAFWSCALIMSLIFIYNYFLLPKAESEKQNMLEIFKLLKSRFVIKLYLITTTILGVAYFLSKINFFKQIFANLEQYSFIQNFLSLKLSTIIAILMAVIVLITLAIIPLVKKKIYASNSFFAKSFISLLDQPRIPIIIIFILLFRLGESLLLALKSPFFKGIGVSLQELSLANGIFGTIATIAGSIFGGWIISRFSLKKMIWPCLLGQNIFNLLYMFLAIFYADIYFEGALETRPDQLATANFYLISLVIALEAFGAGIGTAAFMVYIMRCVKASYKASHTAFWTAIMSIGVIITGPISGALAKDFGFATYFGISFLITIPSMLLVLVVPYLGDKTAADYDH